MLEDGNADTLAKTVDVQDRARRQMLFEQIVDCLRIVYRDRQRRLDALKQRAGIS